MVNIKNIVSAFLPLKLFLDKGYAAHIVIIIPSIVNNIVTTTEIKKEYSMEASDSTFLYASKEKPLGIRNTLFAITKDSSLIDFAKTCINGNKQVNATSAMNK